MGDFLVIQSFLLSLHPKRQSYMEVVKVNTRNSTYQPLSRNRVLQNVRLQNHSNVWNDYLRGVSSLGNLTGYADVWKDLHIRRFRPVVKVTRLRIRKAIMSDLSKQAI